MAMSLWDLLSRGENARDSLLWLLLLLLLSLGASLIRLASGVVLAPLAAAVAAALPRSFLDPASFWRGPGSSGLLSPASPPCSPAPQSCRPPKIIMVLSNDIDLLHPPADLEKRKHKLKRLVQSPNSFFMDVKCQGCFSITTVFSHSQTVVLCGNCSAVLCQPTGGRARLTEGSSFRKKGD